MFFVVPKTEVQSCRKFKPIYLIPAPLETVYPIAKDIERFPEFFPDVESVCILEQHGARLHLRMGGHRGEAESQAEVARAGRMG